MKEKYMISFDEQSASVYQQIRDIIEYHANLIKQEKKYYEFEASFDGLSQIKEDLIKLNFQFKVIQIPYHNE